MELLIRGGQVIDPAREEIFRADVLVENGRIVRIAPDLPKKGREALDAGGRLVSPGFIDIHVHLREPGQEYKEDVETGLRGAVKGGFTSVLCMPNTRPAVDNRAVVRYLNERARQVNLARLFVSGCITRERKGKELAEIGEMIQEGIRAVTDDGDGVQDARIFRRALEYSKTFNIPVMEHCEDEALFQDGVMNEGYWSTVAGLRGAPSSAETVMAARDILIAEQAGGRYHLTHLSSRRALELVREAKTRGLPVTCDVTPHHLALTDAEIGKRYDTNLKVNPPLRTEEDRQALVRGLVDGAVDAIATDHAPHVRHEKDVSFDEAPFGIIGLESALPVLATRLAVEENVPLPRIVRALTLNPAVILGLEGLGRMEVGALADLTVFDLEEVYTLDAAGFESKSANCPFDGWKVRGRAVHVTVEGRPVMRDGRIVENGEGHPAK